MDLDDVIKESEDGTFSGYTYIGRETHKAINGFLKELKQLRVSAIRTATAFLSNSAEKQWKHVKSENREERDAWLSYINNPTEENKKALALELVDGKSVRQTMLRCLGYSEDDILTLHQEVYDKNAIRGYYNHE